MSSVFFRCVFTSRSYQTHFDLIARCITRQNYLLRVLAYVSPVLRSHAVTYCKRTERMAFLKTTKLDIPEFHKLFTPELQSLIELFDRYHYELRIAGGAVRDLLMGKQPSDIDFATTATPGQMKTMFETEEIRMINNRGEKHGTVTCRINHNVNFEVTTLRIDVETDGRHAEVKFTTDWQLDSERRDLTINSMFLGFDGTLYDYYNGKEDLEQRKVCFVGNANTRIQEDYLRILRYFRFYGRISINANAHSEETLKAIRENAAGLKGISGERIWVEMKKIVTGQHVGDIMRIMYELGITQYLGLPSNANLDEFERVSRQSANFHPLPMTLLSALFSSESQINDLHKRVKMSKEEFQLGRFVLEHKKDDFTDKPFDYFNDLIFDEPGSTDKLKDRVHELLKYSNQHKSLEEFSSWTPPKFPVSGNRLIEVGVPQGKKFTLVLNFLRVKWKESRYTLKEEELLAFVEEAKRTVEVSN